MDGVKLIGHVSSWFWQAQNFTDLLEEQKKIRVNSRRRDAFVLFLHDIVEFHTGFANIKGIIRMDPHIYLLVLPLGRYLMWGINGV